LSDPNPDKHGFSTHNYHSELSQIVVAGRVDSAVKQPTTSEAERCVAPRDGFALLLNGAFKLQKRKSSSAADRHHKAVQL
jgi:hypothetical protein